jgi:AraC-like DNA-binding protein
VALNVLSCGAEVEIDPGERGDYYLLQLPLQGRARVSCNGQEAWVGTDTMSVLQPRAQTRMVWTSDCAMIMVQIPSQMLRNEGDADSPLPALRLTRSSHDPAVAAWWQAMTDMTRNLRSHGDTNRLQRALDHIHANIHAPHGLAAIAAAACMSPRALEAAFRRRFDLPPLAYARAVRLEAVHRVLQLAARNGHPTLLSDAALQHGFIHMGRFAAYYEQRFGCSPSVTLRGHAQH